MKPGGVISECDTFALPRLVIRSNARRMILLPSVSTLKQIEHITDNKPEIQSTSMWIECTLLAEAGVPAVLYGVMGGRLHAKTAFATVESSISYLISSTYSIKRSNSIRISAAMRILIRKQKSLHVTTGCMER